MENVGSIDRADDSQHNKADQTNDDYEHLLKLKAKPGSQKREDYLSWDEYFMAIAFLSAQRSKDPRTQVGAAIINDENKIVGIGYNGMPIGCSDDVMPWGRNSDNVLETKQLYVCHAELNAVLNRNAVGLKNCRIYVALFPCNECAKVIIQSGIKEVIYYSNKYGEKNEFVASKRMLKIAGVKLRQYRPECKQIVIDFSLIDRDPMNPITSQKGEGLNSDMQGLSLSTHSSNPAPQQ